MAVDYKALADAYTAGAYLTVEDAFKAMSAEVVSAPYKVLTSNDLRIWAAENPTDYTSIEAAAVSSPIAKIALKLIDLDAARLDLNDPDIVALISGLVSAGVLSTAGQGELFAKATQTKPKWPGLKIGHIKNAVDKHLAGVV